jgi:RND family efflux transporter MFP subunit
MNVNAHPVALATVLMASLLMAGCSKPEPAPEPTRSVKLMTVGASGQEFANEYAGDVRARSEARLGFRVAGKLAMRSAEVGQRVKAGQVLAQLDVSDYQLAEQAAQAQVQAATTQRDLAAADYKRYAALREQNFISGAELERRDTTLKAAQASLDQALAQGKVQGNQRGYTTLVADKAGTVVGVDAEVGQVLTLGAPVVRLAYDGPRDVVVSVPEHKAAAVRVGQPASVRLWAADSHVSGQVREVAASADPVSRTFAVKVALAMPKGAAQPEAALGATAYVQFAPAAAGTGPMLIKLPTSALWQKAGGSAVWLFDPASSTVKAQPVVVATADGNQAVIAAGLKGGEQIVVAGVHVLTDGQKVVVFQEKNEQKVDLTQSNKSLDAMKNGESRSGSTRHIRRKGPAMSPSQPQNPSTGFNLSRWALEHKPLTRYLMVVLMLLGIASYFQLGQDEDPPFTFRAMVVRAYWPGATAQQIAEQVTDKLEKTLQEVPHADKIRSYSKPGETLIIFQVKDSTQPADVTQTWYTVRKKIGDIRATLPQGVVGPFYNDEFGDVFGVIYALQGDGYSYADLKRLSDDVRQQLLKVKDVNKVELFGVQDEKLFIEISQRRLASLGLDMNAVLAQLGQQNAVESAGAVQSPLDIVQVRVGGAFGSVDQLKAMPIRTPSGAQLRLADLADIKLAYVDPPQVKVRHQGKDSIALGISMTKGGDIIALGKALKVATDRIERELPAGVRLEQVQDQPSAVTRSVNEFVNVLIEAVVIVLVVSFLSLGLHRNPNGRGLRSFTLDVRPGLVVGITIPLVLAVTFLAMHYWGIGLHKISLGSLIIALGLLVDDAIIAVEMMVRKLEEGYTMFRAATFTWDATAMPMLTGTLITATGFLPIGMAKSSVGEYTFAIFAVTVIALVVSWFAAVVFVPYLGVVLLKVKPHLGDSHEVFDGPMYTRFRALVNACVKHRWLTIGATILVFALGLVGMGKVQQQFFPDSSRPEILVDLWLPEGSSFAVNESIAKRVEARLAQEPGVKSVSTWVGSGVPRFYLPLDQTFRKPTCRNSSCCRTT